MNGPRDIWEGRPVTFVEFSIRDGEAMLEGMEIGSAEGSYRLLALSMRWLDTGEPVFPDTAAIWAMPFRLRSVIGRLAAKAAFVNGLLTRDPDDPPPAEPQANGHDAAAPAPSH